MRSDSTQRAGARAAGLIDRSYIYLKFRIVNFDFKLATPPPDIKHSFLLKHTESGEGAIFFTYWNGVRYSNGPAVSLLSQHRHSYARTAGVIFCAAQSCRGLARSRVAAKPFLGQTIRTGINSLPQCAVLHVHQLAVHSPNKRVQSLETYFKCSKDTPQRWPVS